MTLQEAKSKVKIEDLTVVFKLNKGLRQGRCIIHDSIQFNAGKCTTEVIDKSRGYIIRSKWFDALSKLTAQPERGLKETLVVLEREAKKAYLGKHVLGLRASG